MTIKLPPKGWTQLREMRIAAQLEQGALAEQAGVSQSTISLWEHGRMRPSPTAFARLQAILPGLELPAVGEATAA